MSQSLLDPIAFSQSLQDAGMPKEQANLIAQAQEARIDKLVQARELATKADLQELELRLTAKINEAQLNLVKWMLSLFAGFGALLFAAMAWLMPR